MPGIKKVRSPESLSGRHKNTITLAIDKDVLNALRRDAIHEHVSLNSHINNILTKWDKFFRYHQENRVITMTSKNFEKILELVDEKEFVEMWNDNALNIVSTLFAEKKIPVTLQNLVEYVFRPFGVIGGAFSTVDEDRDEERCARVIFTHKYGPKWSRIIAASFSHQLEAYFKCHTKSTISPGTVTITILDKSIMDDSKSQ